MRSYRSSGNRLIGAFVVATSLFAASQVALARDPRRCCGESDGQGGCSFDQTQPELPPLLHGGLRSLSAHRIAPVSAFPRSIEGESANSLRSPSLMMRRLAIVIVVVATGVVALYAVVLLWQGWRYALTIEGRRSARRADVTWSNIVDIQGLASPIVEASVGSGNAVTKGQLVLLVADGCDPCEEHVNSWADALNPLGKTVNVIGLVPPKTKADSPIVRSLVEAFGQASLGVYAIHDLERFGHRTGLSAVPTAMLFRVDTSTMLSIGSGRLPKSMPLRSVRRLLETNAQTSIGVDSLRGGGAQTILQTGGERSGR